MRGIFRYSALLIFIVISVGSMAQNATIRGFVVEEESGEPVIFTNVYLKGTTFGSSTDVNGYYSINPVPPGNYTLMVTYLGYDTLSEEITVKGAEIITRKLVLIKRMVDLTEFEVKANSEEDKKEVRVSVTQITPKEAKQIPTIGGQPDLAQYLQVLPGIVFTGDQGGQLYIRGGSPIQNKVLLDGMIIYNPFHSIGLFSVFDMDIIRNADVYTGGFNANYGGRISSIMDITTRDGNKKSYGGKVSAGPFGANLMLEGPIIKAKEGKGGSSSFILSAKNSYLEQSSKIFYDYVDTAGLPFNFTDLYGKISLNADNGSKVNFFGFNFDDQVKYHAISDFHWVASGGGTNFVLIPTGSPLLFQGNFAYSDYQISLTESDGRPRTSEISGFNMGLDFSYFLGKNTIRYGFEVLGFKTMFNFYNSVNRKITQQENTTELAGYLRGRYLIGNLVLEPGFRAHYYASLSTFSPEPRLGMKFNASKKLRIKASAGMYSQNLISANSDRDVVNLFYGFLSGPDNLPYEFRGKTIKNNKLQKSDHFIGGFEYDLSNSISINVEGYYKYFPQLSNINRNKIFDDDGLHEDYYSKDFILEQGDAKGVDFLLKYDKKKFYFWAVYSLAYVTRCDEFVDYVPHYDRRHNVNLVGVYRFGKKKSWEVNARWNFGSGFPFTKTQGFYESLDFTNGINTDYTNINGNLGIKYAELNTGRLSDYHRLDMTLKKLWKFSKKSTLECALSATNIYNRENVFYFNRVTNERVNQLPVMPSFSMTFNF
ncbi:MAG: TonB-dependent receptor [Bacteroidetes bacterium]|nr:TonB-dependent receptor [Bacteroidota bacterium]